MSTVASQMRPEVIRSHTFPSNSAQNTRRRRRDTFVERLLKDPMLQTMADIGKQEGAIKPLPAPQRARTINISEFQQYYRHFQEGNFHQYLNTIQIMDLPPNCIFATPTCT
ncbi:6065_t:CDS:2 [Funneliformis mosseae]|uniref:6065_t:CDS:1 n=1 Tax=Funneliformis mosseae TaxID=27381 RepID=A0A9N8ZAW0_FUNMO|nr:6065_t:CDS:2 [Funneliformis mosseae]